jgi:hypothetical protein
MICWDQRVVTIPPQIDLCGGKNCSGQWEIVWVWVKETVSCHGRASQDAEDCGGGKHLERSDWGLLIGQSSIRFSGVQQGCVLGDPLNRRTVMCEQLGEYISSCMGA